MTAKKTIWGGLICIALSACSTTDRSTSVSDTYDPTASKYSGNTDVPQPRNAPPSASQPATQQEATTASYVVLSIDTVPRSEAGVSSIAGTSGNMGSQSGSSGTSAGTSSGDMVYRIILRMEDGSTRSMTQESQPRVQVGDRVRVADGTVQRY